MSGQSKWNQTQCYASHAPVTRDGVYHRQASDYPSQLGNMSTLNYLTGLAWFSAVPAGDCTLDRHTTTYSSS